MSGTKILERILQDFSKSLGPGSAVQPGHDPGHAVHDPSRRNRRPVDHQHRQPKRAGCSDLRNRTLAAGILGDDNLDPMLSHQGCIARHVERPARHHHVSLEGQGAGRLIHQTKQVAVLRLGREGVDMLAAYRQEHPLRRSGQCGDSGLDIRDMRPAVALARDPGRALQSDERSPSCTAGGDGVAAHLRGKRMRGVDHMGDLLGLKIGAKPIHPAEATQPHVDRLAHRRGGTPGIGIDPCQPRLCDGLRHEVRFGRAAQKKYPCHA